MSTWKLVVGLDGEPLSPYPYSPPDWYVEPRVYQTWTSFVVDLLMVVGDRVEGVYFESSRGDQIAVIPGEPFGYCFNSANPDNVFSGRKALAVLFKE